MAVQGMPSFSIASVIEDVLQQGASLSDNDLSSRKAKETFVRMYKAARWLRKMVGVVLAKDLHAEPSDDEFSIGLSSGVILCSVLNKIQPGAILKVVEVSNDSVIVPNGAASIAYQYFENVRNFLVVVEEMGIPTFDFSDFEKVSGVRRSASGSPLSKPSVVAHPSPERLVLHPQPRTPLQTTLQSLEEETPSSTSMSTRRTRS